MTHDVSFGTAKNSSDLGTFKYEHSYLAWNLNDIYNALANYIHWVQVSLVWYISYYIVLNYMH